MTVNKVAEVSAQYLAELDASVVPAGYKKTEVGVIPEDWKISDVGSEFYMQLGKMLDENKNSGELKLLLGNRAVQWGHIDVSDLGYIRMTRSELEKYRLKFGDILVCEGGEVGRSSIWREELPECYFQKALHRLRPKSEYNPELFVNVMQWLAHKGGLQNFVTQTSIAHLPKDKFELVPLLLPPVEEQTAIANALSDVDALISELEKLIAKKQAIKTATMQQLLTGRTRLPQFALREDGSKKGYKQSELGEIPEDWISISIGKDAVLKARIGWQALTTKEYQLSGEFVLVTGTDFDAGAVKWERCFYVSEWRYKQDANIQLRKDDVLITKDGTIGKIGYVDSLTKPATLNSGVFVVRPKNEIFLPRYLFYVLTSRIFDDFIKGITAGSTITHLYQKDFVNFEFSAPNIDEQTAIAKILSDMDSEIQALQQRLTKTRQIKQGMMQELLTGKTRLIQPAGSTN